jgi:uncharacterized membrane protein YoaK (UPF0700 family)
MKKVPLYLVLSLNGGYVDTVGFLALGGLFTAHVTGNFVTLGASVALGLGGGLAKLLALPVFCLVIFLTRCVGLMLNRHGRPVMRPFLGAMLALLAVVLALAIKFGPFSDLNTVAALAIGIVMIAAMAIQNGLHRVYLTKSPPTTMMTGTTTQVLLDLADLAVGADVELRATVTARLRRMSLSVFCFACGCAMAATAYISSPVWCFAPPVFFATFALFAHVATPEGD